MTKKAAKGDRISKRETASRKSSNKKPKAGDRKSTAEAEGSAGAFTIRSVLGSPFVRDAIAAALTSVATALLTKTSKKTERLDASMGDRKIGRSGAEAVAPKAMKRVQRRAVPGGRTGSKSAKAVVLDGVQSADEATKKAAIVSQSATANRKPAKSALEPSEPLTKRERRGRPRGSVPKIIHTDEQKPQRKVRSDAGKKRATSRARTAQRAPLVVGLTKNTDTSPLALDAMQVAIPGSSDE